MPKISAKFDRGHPLRGRRVQVGWVKIGNFRQISGYISKTVKDRHIVSIKIKSIRSRMRSIGWWHCRWFWVPPNQPKPPHFLDFAPPFTASYRVNLETSYFLQFCTPCNISARANARDFTHFHFWTLAGLSLDGCQRYTTSCLQLTADTARGEC